MTSNVLKTILLIDNLYPGVLPHLIKIYKIGKTDGKIESAEVQIKELREKIYESN